VFTQPDQNFCYGFARVIHTQCIVSEGVLTSLRRTMVAWPVDISVQAQLRPHTVEQLGHRLKWERNARESNNVYCKRQIAFLVTPVMVQRSIWRSELFSPIFILDCNFFYLYSFSFNTFSFREFFFKRICENLSFFVFDSPTQLKTPSKLLLFI